LDGKYSCGSTASAQVCVASTAKVGAASLICGVDDDADEKKEADQPNEKAFDGKGSYADGGRTKCPVPRPYLVQYDRLLNLFVRLSQ
jgi:hypothetical protein